MKLLNDPPGFECPICRKTAIKVSLKAFLTREETRCPHCGTTFQMQPEGCEEMERLLADYQRTYENMEALQGRAATSPERSPYHPTHPTRAPSRRPSRAPRR